VRACVRACGDFPTQPTTTMVGIRTGRKAAGRCRHRACGQACRRSTSSFTPT
jgi:hypothetical protein